MINEALSREPCERGHCAQFSNERSIEDIGPVTILFGFMEGKFWSTFVAFKEADHYKAFRSALSDKYGTPTDVKETKDKKGQTIIDEYSWNFEAASLCLKYNIVKQLGSVLYFSKGFGKERITRNLERKNLPKK